MSIKNIVLAIAAASAFAGAIFIAVGPEPAPRVEFAMPVYNAPR